MSSPSSRQVIKLYRDLLKYGEQLKFTDKEYFKKRIRKEFEENKHLTSSEDILFNFKRGEILLAKARVV
ncbi:mitochondrial ribosome and complex I assembly factor AltMIEF1 [Phlebotomus argentipes]|uniref:mitochondrial ribosome and complex I assembly factor AltMIEF1 n=1 Tax=Phlebotomus argentipes TaxID=94469 RepID=UPI002892FE3D|nr:mitochondrial ribosome and complex I assembly factor AltMIEF1 [Phlebotomus argentipes]